MDNKQTFCNQIVLAIVEEYLDARATQFVEAFNEPLSQLESSARDADLINAIVEELSEVISEAHQIDKNFSSSLTHLGFYGLSLKSVSSIFLNYVRIRSENRALSNTKTSKPQNYSYE